MDKPRVLKRAAFDLTVQTKQDGFIAPPTVSQRHWLFTRAMEELADDLEELDRVSKRFVEGSKREAISQEWARSQAKYDDSQLVIEGQQVMQEWERPYMEAMAAVVTQTKGDVLELGFGMGISASYIQAMGARSYTVLEANQEVAQRFETWKQRFPGRDIRLVPGMWQDTIETLGQFDGIFFDTYPLSEEEYRDYVVRDVTYAQHFFAVAARHLREGGIFTYYSNEIDSVSRRHQRELFKHFRTIEFSVCRPLFPPKDCNYWWADSMIVAKCTK